MCFCGWRGTLLHLKEVGPILAWRTRCSNCSLANRDQAPLWQDPAQCPAKFQAGGKHRSKPVTSFSGWEDLTTTQRENLLSHDTGGVWKRFEGDPCKALWFHSFPAVADAGEAAASPKQHFQLAPRRSGNSWGAARARSWRDLTASRAGPPLPCEKQGRPGDHGQVQARLPITSKLVVMRQV